MSKQYTITGVGNPNTVTGDVKLFHTGKEPFVVTKAWLDEQSKAPAVGDVLEVSDKGALTLVTEAQAEADEADDEVDEAGGQKKSLTSAESGSGSLLSPFREYQGKPVRCHAAEITAVSERSGEAEYLVTFADGSDKIATAAMTSRMIPHVGDFWVIAEQGDGVYEYLNPKAVFEAKYAPVTE